MPLKNPHQFHIPVMGTGFTIDTPVKVARFGISSVMAIGDDELCELIRSYYCQQYSLPYQKIERKEENYRARRFQAYLDLLQEIIDGQMADLKALPFEANNDLTTYFELLPDGSTLKNIYQQMLQAKEDEKIQQQQELRKNLVAGSLDVNIMTKVDRDRFSATGEKLGDYYSDASAALRGYALSKLQSSVIFSAGLNLRLYSYLASFADFFPNELGLLKKKIILKVSDFRSALIQGKFLAKKGLWVSEYRIESGLNCGGHAFPTDGLLMGPILEEFKTRRTELLEENYKYCQQALEKAQKISFKQIPDTRVTYQGGLGTAQEQDFLINYYDLEGTGWGSPFLLVPEAVNVDDETLKILVNARPENYYLSKISPLGVPFNAIHGTASERQNQERVAQGKPGSNCPKAHLALYNTEFSTRPLCIASREYQQKKLAQLSAANLPEAEYQTATQNVTAKTCLCEDLAAGVLIKYGLETKRPLAPAICPGPNLSYFSRIYSLKEMAQHIYGKLNLLDGVQRSHVFINELKLYVDYLANDIKENMTKLSPKYEQQIETFKQNLLDGIEYYKQLAPKMMDDTLKYPQGFLEELNKIKLELEELGSNFQASLPAHLCPNLS